VFTVCDNGAGEACPLWLGHPATTHWGVPDPAAVAGGDEEKRRAFLSAFATLSSRIQLLLNLPIDQLDAPTLKKSLEDIGRR
jgi:arsenate reductase